MSLEPAARVDDPVAHRTEIAEFVTAGIGILCTVVLVTIALPEETIGALGASAVVAWRALSTGKNVVTIIGNMASMADIAAKPLDKALPKDSGAGLIATGFERVLLGKEVRPAARADSEDTKTAKCHVEKVFEGSKTVMLGSSLAPMSRRGDRIGPACGGTIFDGLHTVLVGGPPSKQGISVSEQDGTWLKWTKVAADTLSGVKDIQKVAAAKTAREAVAASASASGNLNAAADRASGNSSGATSDKAVGGVASALGKTPGNLADYSGVGKSVVGAIKPFF